MKKVIVLFFLMFLVMSFLIHSSRLFEFPQKTHAWAQSDRYALALGFLNNSFDFFHPQTYVMNKQFPGNFKVPSDNSITAVDCPIHEFVIAGAMKLFGIHTHTHTHTHTREQPFNISFLCFTFFLNWASFSL